jgi:hypothetical protein
MTRFKKDAFDGQTVAEVWFLGCHSDVGGGDEEEETARIALRWMLGEAVNVCDGLRLNDDGKALLDSGDPSSPTIHESWNGRWRLIEKLPRKEISNDGVYPEKVPSTGSNGARQPEDFRRGGKVFVHATVRNTHSIPGEVIPVPTLSLPLAR